MKRTIKTSAALVAAIAVTCSAAACTNAPEEPGLPATSTEAPPLSGVGPAGRSPGQQATEGAIAAVKGMHKTRAAIENDPRADMNTISQYVTDPYLGLLKADMELHRSKGIVGKGEIVVVNTSPEEVKAPADEDGNPIVGEAEVLLRTCVDVTDYHAFDAEGRDTVNPDRMPQEQAIFRVANESWPSGDGWRVVENTLVESEPCDAY